MFACSAVASVGVTGIAGFEGSGCGVGCAAGGGTIAPGGGTGLGAGIGAGATVTGTVFATFRIVRTYPEREASFIPSQRPAIPLTVLAQPHSL